MTKRKVRKLMNEPGYRDGVLAAIPDDLPDGARMAMMEEYGLDPLDDVIDFEEPLTRVFCGVCGKGFDSESAKQMHVRAKGHSVSKLTRAKRGR